MSGDFQIGEWRVQPAVNRLRRGDQMVRLEPKVMQVLVCLAESAGEVVTREQLIARVWPDVFVTDDVLHRAIRELRRVFGDATAAPRYIETIRKRGYRLIPSAVSDAVPSTVAAAAPDVPPVPAPAANPPEDNLGADARGTRKDAPAPRAFSLVAFLAVVAIGVTVAALATRGHDLAPEAHARFVPVVSGPLNESDPAVSPDGRLVAFVQREPGASTSADIYVRDLASGAVSRLSDHPASDRMPAWNPDGTRLAFVRVAAGECEIILRDVGANHDRRLTSCGNAEEAKLAWTSDGRALLTSYAPMHKGTWRIARIEIATGGTTILTNPPAGIVGDHSPALAPGGRHVAFIRRLSGGVADIYVASIDGSHERRVTFDDADLTGIDWTADGRSLVYSSDRAGGYSLWRATADGGAPALLAGGAARMKHPVADRAGRRIVYENWNYEINLWRIGGGGPASPPEARVTQTSELWNIYPHVSADGRRIAYVSTQSGSHQLWVADNDGANARQLTSGAGAVKYPRWSPDGNRIAYVARARDGVDVHVVDVITGIVSRVTATAANETAPAWSHDGARVLYGAAEANGRWNVWSVDASTGADARVEVADAVAAQAAADGALYFTRADQAGLWRRDASSRTTARVVDQVDAGNVLGWHLTRDAIYFVAERDDAVRLRRTTLTGGASTEIATLTQLSWPGFAVAPDGTIVYARWDRRDSNLMSIEY